MTALAVTAVYIPQRPTPAAPAAAEVRTTWGNLKRCPTMLEGKEHWRGPDHEDRQRWPAARSVITWNASENRHMLAINVALGFRPAGYEGEWQKRLG